MNWGSWTKVVRLTLSGADPWFRRECPPGTLWKVGDELVEVVRWRDAETVWVKARL